MNIKRIFNLLTLYVALALLMVACNNGSIPSLASVLKLDPTRPTFIYFYTPG